MIQKTFSHASVFQVKVLNVSQSYYDKYEMEITQVIKLGESFQPLLFKTIDCLLITKDT